MSQEYEGLSEQQKQQEHQGLSEQQKQQEHQGKIVAVVVLVLILSVLAGLGALLYFAITESSTKTSTDTKEKEEPGFFEKLFSKDDDLTDQEGFWDKLFSEKDDDSLAFDNETFEGYNDAFGDSEDEWSDYGYEPYAYGPHDFADYIYYTELLDQKYHGEFEEFSADINYLMTGDFEDYKKYVGKPVYVYGYISNVDEKNGSITVVNTIFQPDIQKVQLKYHPCDEIQFRVNDFGSYYFVMQEKENGQFQGDFLYNYFDYQSDDPLPEMEQTADEVLNEKEAYIEFFEYEEKDYSSMIAVITNEGSHNLYGTLSVAYYDKDNRFLCSESQTFGVEAECYLGEIFFYAIDTSTGNFLEYDHFEYAVDIEPEYELSEYVEKNNDIRASVEKMSGKTVVTAENTSNIRCKDFLEVILIGDNNKVVADEYLDYDLKKGEIVEASMYYTGDWNKSFVLK